MDAARFNPMTYSKQLEAAGVARAQAEVHAQGLADVVATMQESETRIREDFARLRLEFGEFKIQMQQEFADFKAQIHQEFADFKVQIHQECANIKIDMLKWMFGFWILQSGTIFAMLKYVH